MKRIINDYKGVAFFYLLIIISLFMVSIQNTNSKVNNISNVGKVIVLSN